MKSLVAFLAVGLLWCFAAHAGPFDVTLTCTFPTMNTDSTPLTDLAGIKVYGGVSGKLLATVPKASGCTWTEINATAGGDSYNITAFNAAGAESAHTNNVTIDTTPPPPPPSVPNPPTNLKATTPGVPNTAYQFITNSAGQIVLLPIGTVPPDTACDGTQGVMKGGQMFYAVPGTAITYSGTARPLVAVVACSGAG